jgi:uncharacterized protein YukE
MAGLGNIFQFNFGQVADLASKFGQQKNATDQSQEIVKGFIPKVQSAWIGGDADEFATDIGRKLVPKYIEFALALTGIQVNLGKSSDTSSAGDKQASGLAQGFSDLCSKIF